MKKRLLLIFLLIIPIVIAQPQVDYNDLSEMDLNFNLDSQFFLAPTREQYGIDFIETNLTFFPQNRLNEVPIQTVLSLSTKSFPEISVRKEADSLVFRWEKPVGQQYLYGLSSKINLKNNLLQIKDGIKFPITSSEYPEYIIPTKFIDLNDDIKNKAQELAKGESDLYTVTFKIADWVETNINYNLSTLTADVVQPSSWVLRNKEGVCDELTNLFISMVRSLGIPAKFVSGMAYTNTNGAWGPHAWAEVYFPGKGWVPFDITYGQFGWIDPTHIKLMQSLDSGDPSVKFSWKSYNVDFKADEIKLDTTLVKEGPKIERLVEMTVTPLKNDVGPGSYVPIKINIKNLKDVYLPESLFVIKAPELTERNAKHVLLKPNQERTLFWILKIPDNVEKEYTYSTTFEVRDMFHEVASEKINYASNLKVISKEEAENIIKELDVGEEKTYSKDISLSCNVNGRKYLFSYENAKANCIAKNTGNTELDNVNVCYVDECKNVNILIGQQEDVSFDLVNLTPLKEKLLFSAKNNDVSVNNYVAVSILEDPGLRINNFIPPVMLDYDENIVLDFSLSARAPVKELSVSLNGDNIYDIKDLEKQQNIKIDAAGKDFSGDDKIVLKFKYYDENGHKYEKEEEYPVEIVNLPWYAKMFKWFKSLI